MSAIRFICCVVCVLPSVGCLVDSKEIGNTAEETGEDSSGPGQSSQSASSTMTGSTTEASSGSESTTGVMDRPCHLIVDESECAAASNDNQTCSWLETSVVALDNEQACVDVEPGAGVCLSAERSDTCEDFFEPTCPGGTREVWFNVLGLEIGAVELFVDEAGDMCDQPSGTFELCTVVSEVPLEFDPPECGCGCVP